MAKSLITAIDIGNHTVKVASLRQTKTGLTVLGLGVGDLSQIERNSPRYAQSVGQVIQRVVRKHSIPIGQVLVGLSGRGCMVRYVTVPTVPPWKLKLMMTYEVEEQTGAHENEAGVAYDYQILTIPEFDADMYPMFLALAQGQVVEDRMTMATTGTKRCHDVDLQGTGAFNLFRRSPQCVEDEVSILLDLGADETHMSLQMGDLLLFQRTLPGGGARFTQRIADHFKVPFENAEELKKGVGRILRRDEEDFFSDQVQRIHRCCAREVATLNGGIQSSLTYFYSQFGARSIQPAKLVVTGGGARLTGLPEALAEKLKIEAEHLDLGEVVTPGTAEVEAVFLDGQAGRFAAAIGMATCRLTQGFELSLLPPRIYASREFWGRKIFVWYTAAAALILAIILILSLHRATTHAEKRVTAWTAQLEEARAEKKTFEAAAHQNTILAETLRQLHMREESGRDLLIALGLLRNHTPSDIHYTQIETAGELLDSGEGRTAGVPEKFQPATAASSFQKRRYVLVYGMIVGAPDPIKGRTRVIDLADSLAELPFFGQVRVKRTEALPADSEAIEKAFSVRFLESSNHAPLKTPRPPAGVAVTFVLQCEIAYREGT